MGRFLDQSEEWAAFPYDPELPPPLCFSLPAGATLMNQPGRVQAGGAVWAAFSQPTLMMDPSDRSTWQRPYYFDPGITSVNTGMRAMAGRGYQRRTVMIPPDAVT
jgi:hypothetical protein